MSLGKRHAGETSDSAGVVSSVQLEKAPAVPQRKTGVRDGGAACGGRDAAAHGLPMGSSAVMGTATK